ncbi:LuxR family transcriptional regulator [Kitasatospora sp. NPDC056138]|uniref:LuxR family transcriptional regulator n=1 Tax=Kitasatospora sp. NPDC056138 TaxID=3345724 RepID=UPI0035D70FC5
MVEPYGETDSLVAEGGSGGDESVVADDEFGRALVNVRGLIETAVSRYRDWSLKSRLVEALEPGTGPVREALVEVITGVECCVDVVIAAEASRAAELCGDLQVLLSGLGRDIRVRVLCTHAALDQGFRREQLGDGYPMEVRVARIPFLEAAIVDGRGAVVRTDFGAQASVVRSLVVIEALQALFGSAWRNAELLGDRIDLGRSVRNDFAGRILGSLHTGATDEVAARELRVSVRTYRRYVAEILDALGTKSRFQAGVLAAEAGLLPVRPAAVGGAGRPASGRPVRHRHLLAARGAGRFEPATSGAVAGSGQ